MKDTALLGSERSPLSNAWTPSSSHSPQPLHQPQQKIRIALQGGGTFGAYGAGFLKAVHEYPNIEVTDGSGLSAGAGNLFVFKHAGGDGLDSYWKAIGRKGDAANFLDPFGFGDSVSPSLFAPFFRASNLATPLGHIRSAIEQSIRDHGLAEPLNMNMHISTVVKKDHHGELDPSNVIETLHSGPSVSIEHIIGSAALAPIAQLERDRAFMIDGVAHWDGVYSGKNPNLDMFRHPSDDPLIVVTVDDYTPRQSISDPYVRYGTIHEQVKDLIDEGHCPVYTVELQHQGQKDVKLRGKPSSSIIKDLMSQGYQDGLACLQQIKQDMGLIALPKVAAAGLDRVFGRS